MNSNSDVIVNKKSGRNIAKDILRFHDFVKLLNLQKQESDNQEDIKYDPVKDVARLKDFLGMGRVAKEQSRPSDIGSEHVKVHDEEEMAKGNVRKTSQIADLPKDAPAIGSEHNPPDEAMRQAALSKIKQHTLSPNQLERSDQYTPLQGQDLDLDKVIDSTERDDQVAAPNYGHTMDGQGDSVRRRKINYRIHEDVIAERTGTATYSTERPLGAGKGQWRRHSSGFVTFTDDFKGKPGDESETSNKPPQSDPMIQLVPSLAAQPVGPTIQLPQILQQIKTAGQTNFFSSLLTQSLDTSADNDLLKESDDLDDKDDFEEMANSIKDVDDIIHLYEPSELVLIDPKSEVVQHLDEDNNLHEVLSRTERIKVGIRFARSETKRERKLQIALKRHSDPKTLNRRARQLAIKMLKEKLMHKSATEMSVVERERVERMLSERKKMIDRLALKLVPRIKQIERQRLTHSSITKRT